MRTFNELPNAARDRFQDVVVKEMHHIEGGGVTGYHFKMANGWTVSVQCGPFAHSSNQFQLDELLNSLSDPSSVELPDWVSEATAAEIAAIAPDGSYYEFPNGDTTAGWRNFEEVMGFIEYIARQPGAAQP